MIFGYLNKRTKTDAVLAGFQAVGEMAVAFLTAVTRVITTNEVVRLAPCFALRGSGICNLSPLVFLVGRNVDARVVDLLCI